VHVISTEEARDRALDSGARRFVAKPLQSRKAVDEVLGEIYDYSTTSRRKLLVVEPGRGADEVDPRFPRRPRGREIVGEADGAKGARRSARQGRLRVVQPETPDLELATLMEEMRDMQLLTPPVISFGPQQPPRSARRASASATCRVFARSARSSGSSTTSCSHCTST
jgi:hypothetical protein